MNESASSVGVVVVHWNAPDWLVATVTAFLESRGVAVRVLVVHNGGELPHLPPAVSVLVPERNVGFAGGVNRGIGHFLADERPDFVVVASHDARVSPGTVHDLVVAAREDERLGVVTGTFDPTGQRVGRGRVLATLEQPSGRTLEVVEWVSGALMLIRPRTVEVSGAFDERYHSYGEDREFCWRVRQSGFEVAAVPSAPISLVGSRSRRWLQMTTANEIFFCSVHRGLVRTVLEAGIQFRDLLRDLAAAVIAPDHTHSAARLRDAAQRAQGIVQGSMKSIRFMGRPPGRFTLPRESEHGSGGPRNRLAPTDSGQQRRK